ncbi:hypothetical protein GW916_11010 [bacterium]|nr:hypothetical protein [bacterium]
MSASDTAVVTLMRGVHGRVGQVFDSLGLITTNKFYLTGVSVRKFVIAAESVAESDRSKKSRDKISDQESPH